MGKGTEKPSHAFKMAIPAKGVLIAEKSLRI